MFSIPKPLRKHLLCSGCIYLEKYSVIPSSFIQAVMSDRLTFVMLLKMENKCNSYDFTHNTMLCFTSLVFPSAATWCLMDISLRHWSSLTWNWLRVRRFWLINWPRTHTTCGPKTELNKDGPMASSRWTSRLLSVWKELATHQCGHEV